MIFAQKVLAPGPGNQSKSTFRWSPFQSALSGSLLFMPPAPPALPEVFDRRNLRTEEGEEKFHGKTVVKVL